MGLQPKSLVGLLPRLFVISSGNDKSLVLRIPAFTVKGKEKNHGYPWLYRARGVGKTPRLSLGNRVGVHLWIWSPHGEDAPVPNLLAQLTQPCLIPALVLLPGMARTFLNHRSDQTRSSQHPPAAVHCPQHKSDSRAQCGRACPRPGDLTIFPFPPGEAPTQTSAQPCRATPVGLSLPLACPVLALLAQARLLLPDLALAAPACGRAAIILLVPIPVPVFLLLQSLEQQLVGEASQ